MVKIQRDANGAHVVTLGDILKIVFAIIAGLAFYFSNRSQDAEALHNVDKVIGIHEEQIRNNKETNDKQDNKIEKLFETKADK